jgi:hypothetical protein
VISKPLNMQNNLTYNILTFDLPSDKLTFYFSEIEITGSHKIHKFSLSAEIKENFTPDIEFLYTTFTDSKEDFTPIDLEISNLKYSFIKIYYTHLIYTYFKENGFLVHKDFVNDIEVRLIEKEFPTLTLHSKFTLRIQIKNVSDKAELLIAYNGDAKVLNRSITDLLEDVQQSSIKKFVFKNNIYNFQKLSDEDRELIDFNQSYPISNLDILYDLKQAVPAPDNSNKYIKFTNKIKDFIEKQLKNDVFTSLIPITDFNFLKVDAKHIGEVKSDSNVMLFGKNENGVNATGFNAYLGLKSNGPYQKCKPLVVNVFYICHSSDVEAARKLAKEFKEGLGAYQGINELAKINIKTTKESTVVFENEFEPFEEIQNSILNEKNFDDNETYFAIYLSHVDKHHSNKTYRKTYYKLKQLLLKKNIHSQVIVKDKMITKGENFGYSLNNIAIAMLAKLGGIPWRIKATKQDELIIGVGAFKNTEIGVRYIGSAFSFQNTGLFNEFDCFVEHSAAILAGSIHNAVKKFTQVNTDPQRLIIHFYKTMGDKEIKPILNKLKQLGLDIPVFIVTINKTESRDIIAWDNDWENFMPLSGKFVKIGYNNFLLFNNTRYQDNIHSKSEGYPFPVKLKFTSIPEEALDGKAIRELIDQIYQFSRMYWKSVKQQHLPVTIKYPEMVAEIFPHFEDYDLPEFGKDKLWFL